ncbi:MAG: PfkB family carbohydrate kinase, partial [Nanoarchaeota archaeon]
NINVRLIVPYGHTIIQTKLPQGLEYAPLYGMRDEEVPMNLNFAPVNGKKITLRSKTGSLPNDQIDLGLSSDDVVVLNTIRNPNYLRLLEDSLKSNENTRLFLSATDSMIQSIGDKKVWELIGRSDVYVSNREELEKMVGTQINDSQTLAEMMYKVQLALKTRDGSLGRVYVTFGEYGSAALGQEKLIYYQAVASGNIDPFKKLNVVNTNGCGDAYLSVVVIKEILSHSLLEILNDANTSGHICATMPTASGTWMATERKIRDFRDNYGKPDFHRYDQRTKEFIRIRM